MVDFLFVITGLFSLALTAETLSAEICRSWHISFFNQCVDVVHLVIGLTTTTSQLMGEMLSVTLANAASPEFRISQVYEV